MSTGELAVLLAVAVVLWMARLLYEERRR